MALFNKHLPRAEGAGQPSDLVGPTRNRITPPGRRGLGKLFIQFQSLAPQQLLLPFETSSYIPKAVLEPVCGLQGPAVFRMGGRLGMVSGLST